MRLLNEERVGSVERQITDTISFHFRLSLPIGQSQKSSATGQAELQLGSLCNAARNRKNESIKVCRTQINGKKIN